MTEGYREATGGGERLRIDYGPFPVRGGTVAAVLVFGTCGVAAAVLALNAQDFRCARGEDGSARCLATRTFGPIQGHSTSFDPSGIEAAELVEGRKNLADAAWTRLVMEDGSSMVVMMGEPEWAAERHARLRSFLRGEADAVQATSRTSVGLACPALGSALLLIVALVLLARGPKRLVLEPDPAGKTLHVRVHRRLLPPRREARSLEDVVAVRASHGTEGRARRRVGQILLGTTDGEWHALTKAPLPGTKIHDEAAQALRQALGVAADHST